MGRQIMPVLCTIVFLMMSGIGVAQAVSLGKVDVASHLGEPFYGEIVLGLDKGEVISSVFVELASPADYRILEVFRDQALNAIRTDVKSDSRGSRVELTSNSAIESPFFNLVIKVRHGRATHFKKYAVFLDLPRAAKAPVNTPASSEKKQPPVQKAEVVIETSKAVEESTFKAYEGWARTGQYGPMVFGDTITTVAKRLRVDERYSNKQIMVALFEKNRAKFDQNNINLIKAGTFLDVPTADEVEQVTRQRARDVLKEHNRQWRELTKQSKYAKVKSAQENRYSKRIHMGEQASGVAAAPLTSEAINQPEVVAVKKIASQASENTPAMTALETENDSLQKRLSDMEAKLSKLIEQPNASEMLAASESRIKKLELQLARQSNELEKARQQVGSDGSLNLLTWLLMGVIALLILIAAYLAFALRGQRQMPAELKEQLVATNEPLDAPAELDLNQSVDNATESLEEADTVDILDDAIPALTDEETSEMEAFQEPDEEADPNVDYLSEADVYMRYGMEDEAEKQVKMALRMREDNKDAHVKLVQMRHARGDQTGVEEAANVARAVLQGGALVAFIAAYDVLSGSAEAEVNLDDTMPPTVLNSAVEESANSDELEVDDFDLPDFSADATEPAAPDGLEKPVVEEASEEVENSLDHLNLSDIEWSDELVDDGTAVDEVLEEAELDDDSAALIDELVLPSDNEELEASDVVADFNENSSLELSDLDMSVAETAGELRDDTSVAASIEEQELDSTVVMDWSKDTSIIQKGEEAGSESGASEAFVADTDVTDNDGPANADLVLDEKQASSAGLEIDVSGLASLDDEVEELVSADSSQEPEEDVLSGIDLSLDDLDVDMSAVEHDAEVEEFTSTIQATLTELGVDDSEVEMLPSSTGEGESVDTPEPKAEPQFGDFDASLELESLLSDLEELESDEDKKAK